MGVLRWLHDGRDLQPPPHRPRRIPAHAAGRWCRAGSGRGEPLPLLPAFADAAQQARFLELWDRRWNEIVTQLDADVKTLDDERTFQPEAMDMRGAVASLPEAERAEMEGQEIPSFGQVWALGFMSRWKTGPKTGPPRATRKPPSGWTMRSTASSRLTEDDTGKPEVCMYNEDGPPSTSQARVEAFGEADLGRVRPAPAVEGSGPACGNLRKAPEPGRNDPCHCGSGRGVQKCHGA